MGIECSEELFLALSHPVFAKGGIGPSGKLFSGSSKGKDSI